ncbi:hypothetical protein FACS1894111_08060 [Clostridia bacterium]|nr:hypothetical protein FACS1894111_08060 [Clostridia bacterium]
MLQTRPISDLQSHFPEVEINENIETKLDEADRFAENSDVRYSHEAVFSRLKKHLYG